MPTFSVSVYEPESGEITIGQPLVNVLSSHLAERVQGARGIGMTMSDAEYLDTRRVGIGAHLTVVRQVSR